MANLIDKDYFFGSINLPGVVLDGDLADIDYYIQRYEPQVLTDLLGYDLYKALQTQIDAGSYTAPYDDLVNGAEYMVESGGDTYTVKWNGLINDEKISLIAYYVYFYYVRDHVTNTAVMGEVLGTVENATRITPADKMAAAWDDFKRLYGCVSDSPLTPSAYRYLIENEDYFNRWVFTVKGDVNRFDI